MIKKSIKLSIITAIFTAVSISVFMWQYTNAQEQTGTQNETNPYSYICTGENYEIIGADEVKLGTQNDYIVKSEENDIFPILQNNISYKLFKNNQQVTTFVGPKYSQTFITTGDYILEAKVTNIYGCENFTRKNIKVSSKFITYIGEEINSQYNINFENYFHSQAISFKPIIISQSLMLKNERGFNIGENENFLKNSDIIIINSQNSPLIMEYLSNMTNTIDYKNKQVFIISDTNQDILRSILANYSKKIGKDNVFMVEKRDLLTFINILQTNGDPVKNQNITKFSLQFSEIPKYQVMAYVINNMIYNGIPSYLIGVLLSLCVILLILNIAKQVIGISIFGIFSPILFGLSMIILGVNLSIVLLLIGTLAFLITNFITRYVYLLYNAKTAMLGTLAIIILIIYLWADSALGINFIKPEIITNNLIIFPLLFIILRSKDLIDEEFKIFSMSSWLGIIEFIIIVGIVYFVLTWTELQYFLIIYPETILLIFILNIIVGKFTGLQVLEYIRFIPLIKKNLEEE